MYEDEHYIFIAYADADMNVDENVDANMDVDVDAYAEAHIDAGRINQFVEMLKLYFPKNAVFFAKEDLPGSENWEKVLQEKIKNALVIIPIISENFKHASYPNQEIGMGISLNKIIYPIKLESTNPPGFIHIYQADSIKEYLSDNKWKMRQLVVKLIEKMKITTKEIIEHSPNIISFYETNILKEILAIRNDYNSKDIDILKKALKENGQIYMSRSKKDIEEIIEKFEQKNHNT